MSTFGLDEETIRKYIREKEAVEKQMQLDLDNRLQLGRANNFLHAI